MVRRVNVTIGTVEGVVMVGVTGGAGVKMRGECNMNNTFSDAMAVSSSVGANIDCGFRRVFEWVSGIFTSIDA